MNDKVIVSQIELQDSVLIERISSLFHESGNRLSVKNMFYLLKEEKLVCSEKRVSRLMKSLNLKCLHLPKSISSKEDKIVHFPEFNKLKQQFNQSQPNIF